MMQLPSIVWVLIPTMLEKLRNRLLDNSRVYPYKNNYLK